MFKAASLIRRGSVLCAIAIAVACTLSACSNSSNVVQPEDSFKDTEVPIYRGGPPPLVEIDVEGGGGTSDAADGTQESPDIVTKGNTPTEEWK